ncbi:MAG: undecaprenyl/decaprenyl-phosphate alpha-N-acetylglucosaminyl 1-phosphate transferase, partial [Treponema sp.]|nr:undecaprenyl/decaprenyl-phosphate alpha-N-acetylglucosaminyl 1-phosphate transferase [Treponema sp.]
MTYIIAVVIASFVLSFITVWLIYRLSHRKAWYDQIDERKIHTGDVPRLGGIGFSVAFIVVSLALFLVMEEIRFNFRFISVFIGLFVTLAFGVLDDFRNLPSGIKLLVQIIAGLLVIIPGYTFHNLFFFGDNFRTFVWLRFPLSLLWIVGLTNAINFIDGVDGLAGGISVIITVIYAVIFASFTNSITIFCICLVAAIGGFLVFNLPLPQAKIFMGDGGSQFLGFTLAVLPLLDLGDTHLNLPIPYASALLLIPILDMISAIWRRLRDGRRIDSPDKAHIHHKLMNLGLNTWGIDGVLYSLQIVLGTLIFFAVKFYSHRNVSLILLGLAYLIAIAFFITIHYSNRTKMLQVRGGGGGG